MAASPGFRCMVFVILIQVRTWNYISCFYTINAERFLEMSSSILMSLSRHRKAIHNSHKTWKPVCLKLYLSPCLLMTKHQMSFKQFYLLLTNWVLKYMSKCLFNAFTPILFEQLAVLTQNNLTKALSANKLLFIRHWSDICFIVWNFFPF